MGKKQIGFILVTSLFLAMPTSLFANGGDQRVVGGRYVVNFSRAPFTPRVATVTNMIVSFLDITTDKAVYEPATLKYSLFAPNGTVLYESGELESEGSVFEFPYTFQQSGLHEIRIEFAFKKDPKTVFTPHHFLIDVQRREEPSVHPIPFWVIVLFGCFAFILGWFLGSKRKGETQ